MADLWPWIAVAGLGALHGLSPATGCCGIVLWPRALNRASTRHVWTAAMLVTGVLLLTAG